MGTCIDFLNFLDTDVVLNIFNCLDDPGDLVRASTVSRVWRHFIIENGFSKRLCVEMFPQLRNIERVTERDSGTIQLTEAGSSKSVELEMGELEHKVYITLLHALNKLITSPVGCILDAIAASSTDNYPDESIINTLDPRDRLLGGASYWSSKGQKDPNVPESLIYKLRSNICMITEIHIQPFEAYFQPGDPIYSAKSVRFRMGHARNNNDDVVKFLSNPPLQEPIDNKFVWTYVSPEFSMTQENRLQHFKLPKPGICLGGYLQIELCGRVQRQEMDDLFYICIRHVKVLGRPLSPAFHVEVMDSCEKFLLTYWSDALPYILDVSSYRHLLTTPEELSWGLRGRVRIVRQYRGENGLLQYFVGENLRNYNDYRHHAIALDYDDD